MYIYIYDDSCPLGFERDHILRLISSTPSPTPSSTPPPLLPP